MKNKQCVVTSIALLVILTAACALGAGSSAIKGKSTDKNVTVQFKDVPVKDALDILFQGRGLNYMLDHAAAGTVNASLTDVSFETALHATLKSAGLTVTKDQGIYIIAPQKEATTEAAPTTEIVSQPTIAIERPKSIERIPVGYSDVFEIAAILNGNSNSLHNGFGNTGYQGGFPGGGYQGMGYPGSGSHYGSGGYPGTSQYGTGSGYPGSSPYGSGSYGYSKPGGGYKGGYGMKY